MTFLLISLSTSKEKAMGTSLSARFQLFSVEVSLWLPFGSLESVFCISEKTGSIFRNLDSKYTAQNASLTTQVFTKVI